MSQTNNAYTESVHFKLGLSSTHWDKLPEYSVWVDDTMIVRQTCTDTTDTFFIEFDCTLTEAMHQLKVRLENKTESDTVQNDDKTAIVKDMLLNITALEVDEINIKPLLWDLSTFTADDPARPELKRCVNLGWNGTWALPFEVPAYIWLLENI